MANETWWIVKQYPRVYNNNHGENTEQEAAGAAARDT